MGESTSPYGKDEKKQAASKKTFELATASPTDFFTHILLLLIFLNVWVFSECYNNIHVWLGEFLHIHQEVFDVF